MVVRFPACCSTNAEPAVAPRVLVPDSVPAFAYQARYTALMHVYYCSQPEKFPTNRGG